MYLPDAYLGMFRLPPGSHSPVQIGIGLGLVQGLLLGVGVGIILVGIVAWHDVRTQQLSQSNQNPSGDPL